MTMTSSLLTSSGLVGESLAPNPGWATLPTSIQFLFTMFATLPAALLMQRKGRRFGFILACVIMMFAGVGAAVAIQAQSFAGFVVSTMGFGVAISFFQLFRFAAIDVAPAHYASRAISWVLAGGLIAAFLGPNMASITHLLDNKQPFFYTMLCAVPIGVLMITLLWKVDLPSPSITERSGEQRPLKIIVQQPVFIVAVVCAMIAYSMMTLLMTATPLAMKGHGYEFGQTAFIIQWHIVGMFAPSFFSGALIARVGVLKVMLTGVVAYFLVVLLNMQPQTMTVYWFALVLLGIGWNFLFVGATTLLQETWLPAEKGKIQGVNDTLVFSMSAMAAMGSGLLYANYGWKITNLVSLPFSALAACLIIYLMIKRHKSVEPALA